MSLLDLQERVVKTAIQNHNVYLGDLLYSTLDTDDTTELAAEITTTKDQLRQLNVLDQEISVQLYADGDVEPLFNKAKALGLDVTYQERKIEISSSTEATGFQKLRKGKKGKKVSKGSKGLKSKPKAPAQGLDTDRPEHATKDDTLTIKVKAYIYHDGEFLTPADTTISTIEIGKRGYQVYLRVGEHEYDIEQVHTHADGGNAIVASIARGKVLTTYAFKMSSENYKKYTEFREKYGYPQHTEGDPSVDDGSMDQIAEMIRKIDEEPEPEPEPKPKAKAKAKAKAIAKPKAKAKAKAASKLVVELPPPPEHTYIFKSDYMSTEEAAEVFASRGNWRPHTGDKPATFVYLDGHHVYDKANYGLKSAMRNISDDAKKQVTLKSHLTEALGSKEYWPETHIIQAGGGTPNIFMTGNRYFLKPDKGFSGAGIKIVADGSALEQHLKTNKKYETWVAQEYVEDPHLYKGRKYHIRVLFLVNNTGSYMFSKMPVYLAEREYDKDSENMAVHITHYTSTQEPLYADQLEDGDLLGRINAAAETEGTTAHPSLYYHIKEGVMTALKDVVNAFKPGCYGESPECYEILAADFTMNNDGGIYLLEVNDKIGLKQFNGDTFAFNQSLLHSAMSVAVDHRFPYTKQSGQTNYFISMTSKFGYNWQTDIAGVGMAKNPIPLKLPQPLPDPAELAVKVSAPEEFEAVVYGYILSQGQIVKAAGKAGLKQALVNLGIWDGPVVKAWRDKTENDQVTDTMEIVLKMLKETLR